MTVPRLITNFILWVLYSFSGGFTCWWGLAILRGVGVDVANVSYIDCVFLMSSVLALCTMIVFFIRAMIETDQ